MMETFKPIQLQRSCGNPKRATGGSMTGNWRGAALGGVLLLGTALAPGAEAASKADLERLDNMALLLGRAAGCGLDTDRATGVIGAWFDETFPPGSIDRKRYLPRFTSDIRLHAEQQQSGDSPDSCADIAEAFYNLRW
jgi:hypothetical protein